MRNSLSLTVAAALVGVALLTVPSECSAQVSAPTASETPSPAPDQKPPVNNNNEPLGKKLNETDGVLTPPSGVDPKIHKDPPAETGDRMPVIVPPGEPGGNQNIQPK